ncbi:MAG: substrate-binding domain-containing protein [Acidobacteriia bacterium]|nr:substrate-binding domain-containing protein [Terriglobia bacterium]
MKRFRLVVSLITDENDYQRQQAAVAQEAATRLGVDLQTLFARNDAIHQSQQLLDVIQARNANVNGILVEPATRTAFPKVARAAVESGIAWVVLNCEADYLKELRSSSTVPAFAVSADNHEVGRLQGRQLAALLPRGGSVLYIQGPSHSTVTEQRSAGMLETKPGNVSVRVLKSANWTEDAGYRAVSSWLRLSTAHQENIDVVQAQNDFLALGARRAIQEQTAGLEQDRKSDLPFLGVDGLAKTGQAWVRQGVLAATIIVPPITSHALDALVAALQGGVHQPERTLVGPESFPAPDTLIARPPVQRIPGPIEKAVDKPPAGGGT